MIKEVKIGNFKLGPGHPTFITAEMSGNHGGSIERALEIVRGAKRAGANAIKLQTYKADTITLKCDRKDFIIPNDSPWRNFRTLWDLYDQAYTPWEWQKEIFFEARKIGLEVFSSPFDQSAVDFLEDLDASAYKIASPEITDIPLLERVAATKKPVILSTGLSELSDIELALSTLREAGSEQIIVLKCTTSYPAPISDAHLNTIPDIVKRFGVLSGLSDHTIGLVAPIVAVGLGASFIEKHFTLDDKNTVDSFFSLNEIDFTSLVNNIRSAEKALGKISYNIPKSALDGLQGRRSLYVVKAIKAGELITEDNIRSIRPSFGLHPKYYRKVLGRPVKNNLEPGDRLSWDLID
jgi:pseudaminic acid synthase